MAKKSTENILTLLHEHEQRKHHLSTHSIVRVSHLNILLSRNEKFRAVIFFYSPCMKNILCIKFIWKSFFFFRMPSCDFSPYCCYYISVWVCIVPVHSITVSLVALLKSRWCQHFYERQHYKWLLFILECAEEHKMPCENTKNTFIHINSDPNSNPNSTIWYDICEHWLFSFIRNNFCNTIAIVYTRI